MDDEMIDGETGVTVRICHDPEPQYADPRDNDNLGVMYCWHPHYTLGDERFTQANYRSMRDVADHLFRERKALCVIPLFLLDHSGLAMTCGSALMRNASTLRDLQSNDRFMGDFEGWDTTHVGFIYATEERRAELGAPKDDIERQLRCEVEEYDTFLRGDVFYIVVEDADGDHLAPSVGGFLGYEHAEEEAERLLAWAVAEVKRENIERQFWIEREVITVG